MSNDIIHEKRIAYKGFNSKLQCQPDELQDPFQYEIGKSYEESDIEIGVRGFHAYLNPLLVFSEYGYGSGSRYCEVEVENYIINKYMVCAEKITILRELTIAELLDAPMSITPKELIKILNRETSSQFIRLSMDSIFAKNNFGDVSFNAVTDGVAYCDDPREIAISTGSYGASVSEQNWSYSVSLGAFGVAECRDVGSIACSFGYKGFAKGEKGSWIILACYNEESDPTLPFKYPAGISSVKTFYVDGEKVKANTYYTLHNDELAECEPS